MNIRYSLMAGLLLTCHLNIGLAGSCDAIAGRKDLPPAIKSRLLKSCQQSATTNSCESQARAKKLEGHEKDKFVQKCTSDRR